MSKPDKEDGGIGNLFKIIDNVIEQVHRTKRMFIIMILTVMILPPLALFIASITLEPPFGSDGRPGPPGFRPGDPTFAFIRQLPFIISIVWLGAGIYQWIVLSKWTKRYDRYIERQKRAEEKLGGADEDDASERSGS